MKIDAAGEMFNLSARHLSEWRGPHPDLVGGFERDSAPIQKQVEHIEPADHKHDLARDRLWTGFPIFPSIFANHEMLGKSCFSDGLRSSGCWLVGSTKSMKAVTSCPHTKSGM